MSVMLNHINNNIMKKILLFGAGKIGRSFIGQLFRKSGYELVFADIDQKIVDLLNEKTSYRVITLDSNHPEVEEVYEVNNISALHLSDEEKILEAIVDSDLIASSVGKRGLLGLAEVLARGIKQRYQLRQSAPIDIILAENVRDASDLLREEIKKYLTGVPLEDYIGLVETSIGKMVPIMTREQLDEDPLAVYAEPYNTLIVDELGFRNTIPAIEGISPKKNMKAWVDRKIFIHNLGHAVLSYQANYFYPELIYTWEALEIEHLKAITRETMLQSMDILMALYPNEFTRQDLINHIDDLLMRFSNKSLGDTIYRVGSDLSRKLNKDDRLMTPILTAIELNMKFSFIIDAWVKGCFFNSSGSLGESSILDKEFIKKYARNPLSVLSDHCKFGSNKYRILYEEVNRILDGIV